MGHRLNNIIETTLFGLAIITVVPAVVFIAHQSLKDRTENKALIVLGTITVVPAVVFLVIDGIEFLYRNRGVKEVKYAGSIVTGLCIFSLIFGFSYNFLLKAFKDFVGLFTNSEKAISILSGIMLGINGLLLFSVVCIFSHKLLHSPFPVISLRSHEEYKEYQRIKNGSFYY